MAATLALLVASPLAWQPTSPPFRPQRCERQAAKLAPRTLSVAMAASAQEQEALIEKLRAAPEAQMQPILAESIKMVDQRFFLRLAEMADAASDDDEREAISQLASSVATNIEQMVQAADARLEDDAGKVQSLLRTMASEDGEFDIPIPPERMEALREAIRERGVTLDDTFVATVKAYMSKADTDGLGGMVEVLRTLLQVFAAERLLLLTQQSVELEPALSETLTLLLQTPPAEWEGVLREQLLSEESACDADSFLGVLQDKMGEVVLGMPSGSALQAVLAEYLSELLGMTREVSAEAA